MAGKYARDEFERRFLAIGDLPEPLRRVSIWDRYLTGTRLRLRCVTGGGTTVWKLGKIEDLGHGHKSITNIYLSAEEATVFASLPAVECAKERHTILHGGSAWSVDHFSDGLRIAEIEHDEGAEIELPAWVGREITGDPLFTGYSLAVRMSE